MKSLYTLSFMTLAFVLSGCAETKFVLNTAKQVQNASSDGKAVGRYKIGSPYSINGVWYYPQVDYGYVETGIASWYGPNFHNKETANGEIFDQYAVTAAHRTLPMPSTVRVTNLENGRALIVRVNDRGPFAHGRIIDLSKRSAQLLGFQRQGTAKVRVEILPEESRKLADAYKSGKPMQLASLNSEPVPTPTAAPSVAVSKGNVSQIPGTIVLTPPVSSAPSPSAQGSAVDLARQSRSQTVIQTEPERTEIFVQAGAFTNANNADKLTQILSDIGPVRIDPRQVDGKYFYRVRLGPLDTVEDADRMLEAIIGKGYPGARVIVE